MRTARQIEASRLNGAKSRGPVTDTGKRKSSRNSHRHGLYSKTIEPTDIPDEVTGDIATFRAGIEAEYHSGRAINSTPDPLTENLIQAYGLLSRINAVEHKALTEEISRQKLTHPEESEIQLHSLAFRRLADETGTLHLVDRLERRYSFRQYQLALTRLINRGPLKLAAEHEFAETNPAHIPERTKNAETNPANPATITKNEETNPSHAPDVTPHQSPKCANRPHTRTNSPSPQNAPEEIDIIETESPRTRPAQAEMTTRLLVLIAVAAFASQAQPNPDYRAVLNRYCVTCHNEVDPAALPPPGDSGYGAGCQNNSAARWRIRPHHHALPHQFEITVDGSRDCEGAVT